MPRYLTITRVRPSIIDQGLKSKVPVQDTHLRHVGLAHAAARSRSIVERLDVVSPLLLVGALDAAVVGYQAVDLALDVGRLGPHGAAAGVHLDLVLQLVEQHAGAVVVRGQVLADLVRLVDRVDGFLDVPQTVAGCVGKY